MIEGIWQIVEMRGPSVVSLLLMSFMFYLIVLQRTQIKKLNNDLDKAEDSLHKRIEKTLEKSTLTIVDSNEKIVQLQIEMGKITEAMKGISRALDDMKIELRTKK